jgi:hypothetical protein
MIFGFANAAFLERLVAFGQLVASLESDGLPADLAWKEALRQTWPDDFADDGL